LPRSNGRPLDRQPLVLEDVPQPSLPVCGFCGAGHERGVEMQTAFMLIPWINGSVAHLATIFCKACKAVFSVQVVHVEAPQRTEPLIMTPGEAFRP
jgi:hypothetical protein